MLWNKHMSTQGPWGQGGGQGGGQGNGKGEKPSNPWGGGSNGGNGGYNGPPQFENMFRKGQDQLKDWIPGGQMGGRGGVVLVLGAILVWLATGFYTVRPDEVGLNLVFGKFTGKTAEGLRYNFPYPLGEVIKPRVTSVNRTEVGYRSGGGAQGRNRDVPDESLMLTGDENIVDIDFDVQWQIDAAKAENYVFNLQNPDGTIKSVAESVMREVIGRRNVQSILTTEQVSIAGEVRQIMQQTLDNYKAGVQVNVVQLQGAVPPAQVREAFFDVNAAQQDQVRVQNEAETYASRIVPEARGDAARVVQQAEGYRERALAEANGQASRFNQVYEQYRKSPDIIRQRIYLETMERVLGGMDKVILDQNNQGSAVLPYLSLNELSRKTAPSPTTSPGATR